MLEGGSSTLTLLRWFIIKAWISLSITVQGSVGILHTGDLPETFTLEIINGTIYHFLLVLFCSSFFYQVIIQREQPGKQDIDIQRSRCGKCKGCRKDQSSALSPDMILIFHDNLTVSHLSVTSSVRFDCLVDTLYLSTVILCLFFNHIKISREQSHIVMVINNKYSKVFQQCQ